MALPWNAITPEETKVNAADGQSLNDKYRLNQDNIRARVRDTPTDANWVNRSHLKTAQQELSQVFVIVGTKMWAHDVATAGYTTKYILYNITGGGAVSFAGPVTFTSVGEYGFIPETKFLVNTFFLRSRYIQASRNEPIIWIKKHILRGVETMVFDPESSGFGIPFGDDLTDCEILVIELRRSVKLCEHLFQHYSREQSFLSQIERGLNLGAIILKDQVDPLLPEEDDKLTWLLTSGFDTDYDVVKSGAAPALYVPDVKVVNFTFDETKM